MTKDAWEKRYNTDLEASLIFSVTGHMDIPVDQHKDIEDSIVKLFDAFGKRYAKTKMVLLTPLSDGGDRIAARAAMRSDVMIAPVFPSVKDEYKKTIGLCGCDSATSVKEFEDILADKERTYTPCELPKVDLTSNNDCVKNAYRNLSAYIIANSHVLIALWDGNRYSSKASAGGTYDTVRMAYRGVDNDVRCMAQPIPDFKTNCYCPDRYLDVTEDCLVYFIQVGRNLDKDERERKGCISSKNPLPKGTSGYIVPDMVSAEVEKLESKNKKRLDFGQKGTETNPHKKHTVEIDDDTVELYNEVPEYYDDIFSKIDKMNRDITRWKNKITTVKKVGKGRTEKEKEESMYGDMFGCEPNVKPRKCSDFADKIRSGGHMRDMISRMIVVDNLAVSYQKASFRNVEASILIGVATALFLQLYILFGKEILIIVLYASFLILATIHFWIHKRSRRFQKFIEYRLLAESLRISCYWSLTGINESVTSSCYGYMKNNMAWIRCVLTAWESYFFNDQLKAEELGRDAEKKIGSAWITSQKGYFLGKGKKNSKKAFFTRVAGGILNYILIGLAIVAILFGLTPEGQAIVYNASEVMLRDTILVSQLPITQLAILQLIIIGFSSAMLIVTGVKDKLIHGGTGEQIEAKFLMFYVAEKRIDIMEKDERQEDVCSVRRNIYHELGVQCINEVNDWAFEHLIKDIDVPSK